jgi:hypothetical protein
MKSESLIVEAEIWLASLSLEFWASKKAESSYLVNPKLARKNQTQCVLADGTYSIIQGHVDKLMAICPPVKAGWCINPHVFRSICMSTTIDPHQNWQLGVLWKLSRSCKVQEQAVLTICLRSEKGFPFKVSGFNTVDEPLWDGLKT